MPKGVGPEREAVCKACGQAFRTTRYGKAAYYCRRPECDAERERTGSVVPNQHHGSPAERMVQRRQREREQQERQAQRAADRARRDADRRVRLEAEADERQARREATQAALASEKAAREERRRAAREEADRAAAAARAERQRRREAERDAAKRDTEVKRLEAKLANGAGALRNLIAERAAVLERLRVLTGVPRPDDALPEAAPARAAAPRQAEPAPVARVTPQQQANGDAVMRLVAGASARGESERKHLYAAIRAAGEARGVDPMADALLRIAVVALAFRRRLVSDRVSLADELAEAQRA